MTPRIDIVQGAATPEELAALATSLAVAMAAAANSSCTMPSARQPAAAWLGRAAGWQTPLQPFK
ncbi:MAG: hypothetical protein LBD90_08395 [Bifidobacteriaceae bacterium]|nr:hypothetical protein [Bifidobacteriaceae bacterium]